MVTAPTDELGAGAASLYFWDREQSGLLALLPALIPQELVGCPPKREQGEVPLGHFARGLSPQDSLPLLCQGFVVQGHTAWCPCWLPSQPLMGTHTSTSWASSPDLTPASTPRVGSQVLVGACESHRDLCPPCGPHRVPWVCQALGWRNSKDEPGLCPSLLPFQFALTVYL